LVRFCRLIGIRLTQIKGDIMSKEKIGETQVDETKPPTHTVFLVKNKDGKACFECVGTLRPHADGKGFSQTLSFYDWDVSLLIRENR